MKKRSIIISHTDHKRLTALIDSARSDSRVREDLLAPLEGELTRAQVVPADKVPPDIVTMNSVVRLRDLDSSVTEEYELVYPAQADITHHRISVLAPIGTAILGYQVGDVIEWPVPTGRRRLRVEEVLYQPAQVARVTG